MVWGKKATPEEFVDNAQLRTGIKDYRKQLLLGVPVTGADLTSAINAYRLFSINGGANIDTGYLGSDAVMKLPDAQKKAYDAATVPEPLNIIWGNYYTGLGTDANGFVTSDNDAQRVVDIAKEIRKKNPTVQKDSVLRAAMGEFFSSEINKRYEGSIRQSIITSYLMQDKINKIVADPLIAAPQKDKIKLFERKRILDTFGDLLPYTMKGAMRMQDVLPDANTGNITQAFINIDIGKKMFENAGMPVNEGLTDELQSFIEAGFIQALSKIDNNINNNFGIETMEASLPPDTFKTFASTKYHAQRMVKHVTDDPYQAYLNFKALQWINSQV